MKEINFLNKIRSGSVKFNKFKLQFLQENGAYINDYLEIKDGMLLLITVMSSLSSATIKSL